MNSHTPAASPATADLESNRAAIAAVARAFDAAWNRHDMGALAALFAPDADFVNVVGMWWKNREEIEVAHRHSHATFLRDSVLVGAVETIKFLSADIATAHVLWELSGQAEPDGTVGKPRHGILLFVVRRDGGKWLIQIAQNTDIVTGALTRAADKA